MQYHSIYFYKQTYIFLKTQYTGTAHSMGTPWMTAGWSHGHRSMTVRSRYNQQFEGENRQMIERSPTGGRAASRQWPFGWHNRYFPTVALGSPCGDRQAAARWQNDEWIIGTSADHPVNFDCELKCHGCRRMSPGWALQECLLGRPPPDCCRIWCKTRRTVIQRSILLYCDVAIKDIDLSINAWLARLTIYGVHAKFDIGLIYTPSQQGNYHHISREHRMKWVVILGDCYQWSLPWECKGLLYIVRLSWQEQ